MRHGIGFPFGAPVAGVAVRHGDKAMDGWSEKSLQEEVNRIHSSEDCVLQSKAGVCFYKASDSKNCHEPFLAKESVDKINYQTFYTEYKSNNSNIYVDRIDKKDNMEYYSTLEVLVISDDVEVNIIF